MAEKPHTKFKELNIEQKIEHIWEYYKIHFFTSIAVVLFIAWLMNHYIINPPPEITLDVSVFGEYGDNEVFFELKEALDLLVIEEGVNETTVVEFFSTGEDLDATVTQGNMSKMAGKAQIGEFDIMIFGGLYYQNYLQEGALMSLNQLIDNGTLDVKEELLIKGNDVMYDSDDYYVVDVSNIEKFSKMLPSEDEIYLGIFYKAQPIEQIKLTLEYLFK